MDNIKPEQGKPSGLGVLNVAQREMTYGEKAVGVSFNPSRDVKVDEIKKLYARIIDLILVSAYRVEEENTKRKQEIVTDAIREAITACMWAVKGITYKY